MTNEGEQVLEIWERKELLVIWSEAPELITQERLDEESKQLLLEAINK